MIPKLPDLPPVRLPLRTCPHCQGWLYMEDWQGIYELICIACSRTAALWQPGLREWRIGQSFIDPADAALDRAPARAA